MKIQASRRKNAEGRQYVVLEAVAEWGKVNLTFDGGVISQILPRGVDFRDLNEKPITIGEIKD